MIVLKVEIKGKGEVFGVDLFESPNYPNTIKNDSLLRDLEGSKYTFSSKAPSMDNGWLAVRAVDLFYDRVYHDLEIYFRNISSDYLTHFYSNKLGDIKLPNELKYGGDIQICLIDTEFPTYNSKNKKRKETITQILYIKSFDMSNFISKYDITKTLKNIFRDAFQDTSAEMRKKLSGYSFKNEVNRYDEVLF
jgi:hypothetical protein